MIHVEPQPIAVERVQKIRDWLAREERYWLETHVEGLIMGILFESNKKAMAYPTDILTADAIPHDSLGKIKLAAKYQLFLNVLNELTDGEDVSFHTTKITP